MSGQINSEGYEYEPILIHLSIYGIDKRHYKSEKTLAHAVSIMRSSQDARFLASLLDRSCVRSSASLLTENLLQVLKTDLIIGYRLIFDLC